MGPGIFVFGDIMQSTDLEKTKYCTCRVYYGHDRTHVRGCPAYKTLANRQRLAQQRLASNQKCLPFGR
jgi:hypothetical protein